MSLKLDGGTAVVTGAAHGIGRALAHALASKNCNLVLVDIDERGLGEVAAALESQKITVVTECVDVSNRDAMLTLAERVEARCSSVRVLINNAGVSLAGAFETLSLNDVEWIFGINFWGAVYGCHAFLPLLHREVSAQVVNVLSAFGLTGFPGKSAYCATKFALRGFGDALRTELRDSSVGVTAVYPPAVSTDIVRRGRATDATQQQAESDFLKRKGMSPEAVATRIVRAIERRKARVLIGAMVRGTDAITRLAPVLSNALIGAQKKRIEFA